MISGWGNNKISGAGSDGQTGPTGNLSGGSSDHHLSHWGKVENQLNIIFAQTRIQQRRLRPGAEFCHDEVFINIAIVAIGIMSSSVVALFLPNKLPHSSQPSWSLSTRRTTPYSLSSATSWTWSTSWRGGLDRWRPWFVVSDSLQSYPLDCQS